MDSLVSTEWLAAHLGESDLRVVDSSWHMSATGRNGRDEYLQAHIPGARFIGFPTGGHLTVGHSAEIVDEVERFVRAH